MLGEGLLAVGEVGVVFLGRGVLEVVVVVLVEGFAHRVEAV